MLYLLLFMIIVQDDFEPPSFVGLSGSERVSATSAPLWLLLGSILHVCLLWFSGKSPRSC